VFLFFDTENSGLSKDFSQIYEIAMITTDSKMNMMSSIHLDSTRLPWDVPSPGAMLVTGIMPDVIKKITRTHYEMMRDLNEYIQNQNWPVIFAGYNVYGYDQGVLSQNMHQTLQDPFVMTARRDWQSDANMVFDVLELVRAASIYAPSVLKLDIKTPTGLPSMALGNVCRQNGINLSEEDAHGAFSDTRATVDLAKKIKNDAPHIFMQMLKMANRAEVERFMAENEVFAYSQCPYGTSHSIIGTRITDADGSKTESVIWDLNVDPAEFANKTDDELVEVFKLWGSSRFETPIQSLQKHKQPILMPLDQADGVWPSTLDQGKVKKRLKWIEDNPDFAKRLAKAAKRARPDFTSGPEPEQQIYDFPDFKIKGALDQWKAEFHKADWQEKLKLVGEFKQRFSKDIAKTPSLKRYMVFALRLVYANAPELLSDKQKKQIDAAIHDRRMREGEDVPYMTIPKAREELEKIIEERAAGDAKWKHVTDTHIRSLKLFYTQLEKEFADISKDPANQNDIGAAVNFRKKQGPNSR
jgi:exodeoxyribonuclease-1